ncbi:MAG: hypothetical protein KC458_11900, partial [Dehalococcoidia bacterium]|nr:hypothetical protein [Dehalococcoidia bacterium]
LALPAELATSMGGELPTVEELQDEPELQALKDALGDQGSISFFSSAEEGFGFELSISVDASDDFGAALAARGEEMRAALPASDTTDMTSLMDMAQNAVTLRREGDEWQLTPRGTRMIGQNALQEIYRQLKKQNIGNHPVPESGRHGERLDDSKPYEFGDPFYLDMGRTIRNALEREGRGAPVKLHPDDFEVYRTELVTTTATVLMVDLSWSMALRGSFQAAK